MGHTCIKKIFIYPSQAGWQKLKSWKRGDGERGGVGYMIYIHPGWPSALGFSIHNLPEWKHYFTYDGAKSFGHPGPVSI